MTDPRIPQVRSLPAHLSETKAPDRANREQDGPPPPVVRADLLAYLRHHFPEQYFTPENTADGRLWFNQGVRALVKHLELLAERQAAARAGARKQKDSV